MQVIAVSFAQFLPYVFEICAVGIISNMVLRAFCRGWL